MAKLKGDLFLVGSVPFDSVEEVFRNCGRMLGDWVPSLPDGEVGDRSYWILYVAWRAYHHHPRIETIMRPAPINGVEQWKPKSMEDIFQFRLKPGVKSIHFDDLGYASEAAKSYKAFTQARDEGSIAKGVRFQIALPFPQDATFLFFRNPADQDIVAPAYEEALTREIKKIFERIPAKDLAIQFDVCTDLLEMEGTYYSWSRPDSAWQRYVEPLHRLPRLVPEEALLGFHFCYGTFPKKPVIEPKDLALSVRFANAAVAESGRRVDFVHLTVPINRSDDDYFKPLTNLKLGDAKAYLGLINTDGVEGAKKRLAAARKYLSGFGVAAECGFGRENPERVPEILRIHREVAEHLLK
ncbi:MAG: hypothetical protein ACREP6_06735 [Candidatus Binataceae bacterium]